MRRVWIVIILGAIAPTARADVIADWTFETSLPSAAGPYAPEVGSGAASGFHASGSSVYSSPSGNGSAHSFSSTVWAVGDYYQFTFTSAGFTGLTLSFDQTSSNTGPRDFKVQASTNGSAYADLAGGSYQVLANGASPNSPWNMTTYQPAYTMTFGNLPTGIVGIRLVDTSTTSAVVGTVGTDRVDNVIISGTPAAVPEPAALSLLGLGLGLAARSLRKVKPATGPSDLD